MAIDQLALIDLLTNLRNQAPPAISPDATGGSGMGTFADMMYRNPAPQNVADPRAALMQQAFAPRTPELVPEEPQWGKGRQIGSQIGAALADALGAYAAGLGSPVRVNASQQLMDRIRMGQASRDENARRKKSAEDEATQAKARYELGRMEQADQQKRQDELRADDRAFDLYRESGRIGAQEDKEARNRQIGKQENMQERMFNLRLGAAKYGQVVPPDADENALLGAIAKGEREEAARRAADKAGNGDKFDRKQVATGNQIALGMFRGVPGDPKTGAPAIPPAEERMKLGEPPEAILNEFEMELDAEGIYGTERAKAMETFDRYVGSVIRKVKKVKEDEAAAQPKYEVGRKYLPSEGR